MASIFKKKIEKNSYPLLKIPKQTKNRRNIQLKNMWQKFQEISFFLWNA